MLPMPPILRSWLADAIFALLSIFGWIAIGSPQRAARCITEPFPSSFLLEVQQLHRKENEDGDESSPRTLSKTACLSLIFSKYSRRSSFVVIERFKNKRGPFRAKVGRLMNHFCMNKHFLRSQCFQLIIPKCPSKATRRFQPTQTICDDLENA